LEKRGSQQLLCQCYEPLPFAKGEDGWGWLTPPNPLFGEEGELCPYFENAEEKVRSSLVTIILSSP